MKKFSKINESKEDLINDILLEFDLIDGIKGYRKTAYGPNLDAHIKVEFSKIEKRNGRYIFDREKIKTLTEIFSVIERLNDAGFNTYITYLVTNSYEMNFLIIK